MAEEEIKDPFQDEYDKRERIRLYFDPPIEDYRLLILLGIVSMILGIGIVLLFGIIFLVIGLRKRKYYLIKLVSEEEIDEYLQEDIHLIRDYIFDRLKLVKSDLVTEIILTGFYECPNVPKVECITKIGEDSIR